MTDLYRRSIWSKLLYLLLLSALGFLLTSILGMISATWIFHLNMDSLQEIMQSAGSGDLSPLTVEVTKYLQGIFSIGLFLIPALLAARLLEPMPQRFLGIDSFPKPPLLLVALLGLLSISGLAVSDILAVLVQKLPLGDGATAYAKELEQQTQSQYEIFLDVPNFSAYLKSMMLMAVLPAVCEETMFRGALQGILRQGINRHWAVVLSALLFALVHVNLFGLLSIIVLGAVLGYLREWTGSLWVPVVVHFFNNGILVTMLYISEEPVVALNGSSLVETMPWASLIGAVGFGLILYLIHRYFHREKVV